MNRNENTLRTIEELNHNMDIDDRARWLAEVWSVWNHDECRWVPNAPFLVRTEMRDIMLSWPDGRHLSVSTDPVDDWRGVGLDQSLSWQRHPGCGEFTGLRVSRFAIGSSAVGETLWISFEDGQSARFSPAGVIALMETGATASMPLAALERYIM